MTDEAAPEKKKKAKRPRYTQLTLEYLRNSGKIPAIVERLIPSKPFMKRSDMFGLFDLVYFDPETNETGYVQSTSHAGRSEHKKKMLATSDEAPYILRLILRKPLSHAELYTWRKNDRNRWEVLVERVVEGGELFADPMPLIFEKIAVPTMAASRERERETRRIVRRVAADTHGTE
jgi:hypothetical protein